VAAIILIDNALKQSWAAKRPKRESPLFIVILTIFFVKIMEKSTFL